jgi:hypothetical protein
MTGAASVFVAGSAACEPTVKYEDSLFGGGDASRFCVGTSGLVGGEEAAVRAVSERSSSDLVDEAVGEAVLGKMSGALYESIFVV